VGLFEWKTAMSRAAGNPAAGDMLSVWFTQPGYPVLLVSTVNGRVRVEQRHVVVADDDTLKLLQPASVYVMNVNYNDSGASVQQRLMTGVFT
jgi:aminopeptidase N